MVKAVRFGFPTVFAVLAAAGCQSDKLTQTNFSQIKAQSSTQADVLQQLGEPDAKLPKLWTYHRPDKHLVAMIEFDEAGLVTRVQWVDAAGEQWDDSNERR